PQCTRWQRPAAAAAKGWRGAAAARRELERGRDGSRLLEDLLLHVVLVPAELDRVRRERAHVRRPLHHRSARIDDAPGIDADFGAIALLEHDHAARDLEQGGR